MANGTPASDGRDPRTNVISGCTDATAAPRRRSTASSSLVSAPLECSATLPFQSAAPAQGFCRTRNRSIGNAKPDNLGPNLRPTSRRGRSSNLTGKSPSSPQRCCRSPRDNLLDHVSRSPQRTASAPARFPAPTIAMRGFAESFADMPGRIADRHLPGSRKSKSNARRRALYCFHAQASTLQIEAGQIRQTFTLQSKGDFFAYGLSWPGLLGNHRRRAGTRRRARRAATSFITPARWWCWPSTNRVPRRASCWSANIATPRTTICGNSLPAASILVRKRSTQPSANSLRKPDTRPSIGGAFFKFYASPGFVAETMSVYLATGLRAGTAQPEADEVIHKRMVPLSKPRFAWC